MLNSVIMGHYFLCGQCIMRNKMHKQLCIYMQLGIDNRKNGDTFYPSM